MNKFEIMVGNIGSVYAGNNYLQAITKFNTYVKQSKSGIGRAGNESVVMFHNGDIKREFVGKIDQNNEEGDNEPTNT